MLRQLVSSSRMLSVSALPLMLVLACASDPAAPTHDPAASILVTPTSDTLILALDMQLSAIVRDSSGAPLTGYTLAWASSDQSVATVSATGVVVSVGLGVATITATAAGVTGSAILTVAPLITVTPRRPSMFAGDTVQLAARVTDANGTPVDAGPLTWTTGASAVASVSAIGVAQGTAPGLTAISAHAGAGRGEIVIAVLSSAPRPNREIAFLTRGTDDRSELHTIQPDGSDEKLVSIPGEYAGQFTWSPDGSRLAVTYLQYNGAGTSGLYLSNADGSNPVRLFEAVVAPAWSPDGSRLAYSWCAASIDECDIYTISTTGFGTRALTGHPGSEQSPQWSPDGRRIAYTLITPDGSTLWVMDDDGSHQQQLPLPVDAFNPRWSPDGKTIALDNGIGVWLVAADGSGVRPLTPNCNTEGFCDASSQYTVPDWSFDGQKIAYQAFASGGLAVAVSAVAGELLNHGGHVLCCGPVPQWSPNGASIAYIGSDPAPPGWPGIAVMDAGGGGSQFITGAQNAIATVTTQSPGGGKRWRP